MQCSSFDRRKQQTVLLTTDGDPGRGRRRERGGEAESWLSVLAQTFKMEKDFPSTPTPVNTRGQALSWMDLPPNRFLPHPSQVMSLLHRLSWLKLHPPQK
ncbi:hypothetical protein INR49_030898 [Caranx melampygus]|nr:hypothetical protein INR49_030898 [Caranx melampygus]